MTALLFDVDDTLYDQLEPFRLACGQVLGTDFRADYERLFVRSRYYSELVFNQSESGRMTMEDMYVYRLVHAFADLGLHLAPRDALRLQHAYGTYQERIKLLPGMAGILSAAQAEGALLGLLTNGPSVHQRDKIRVLGLGQWIEESHVFISAEIGAAKPDIRAFRKVQEALGLDAGHIYYIGDSFANDVAGAKRAGWKAVWLNRRHHAVPGRDDHPDSRLDAGSGLTPDFTAAGAEELAGIVRGILKD